MVRPKIIPIKNVQVETIAPVKINLSCNVIYWLIPSALRLNKTANADEIFNAHARLVAK